MIKKLIWAVIVAILLSLTLPSVAEAINIRPVSKPQSAD